MNTYSLIGRFLHSLRRMIKSFLDNDDYSKASALSFYTLLSLVPVLAVAFGIAKGFGFENLLEKQILEMFYQQKYFAEKVISFARSTLEQARGSLIAGVGILFLFWSALGILGNLEAALNSIWKVSRMRPLGKRIIDYLPILIFAPIFIIATSSLTFYIVTKLVALTSTAGIFQQLRPFIYIAYYALLLLITWAFFLFIYTYVPNKHVPWHSCAVAAFVTAAAFQIVQWAYIHLQIYLTSYNAIYGSFAAIPLFLLWVQISWLITLSGAEIAYDHAMYDLPEDSTAIGHASEQQLMLLAVALCCERFHQKKPLNGSAGLAQELHISQAFAEKCVRRCVDAQLIAESSDREGRITLYPAADPATISLSDVVNAIDADRIPLYEIAITPEYERIKKALKDWEEDSYNLTANIKFSTIYEGDKSGQISKTGQR